MTVGQVYPELAYQVAVYEDATFIADLELPEHSRGLSGTTTPEELEALRARWSQRPFSEVVIQRGHAVVMDVPIVTVCWMDHGQRTLVSSADEAVAHYGATVMRNLGVEDWVRSELRTRPAHDAGH